MCIRIEAARGQGVAGTRQEWECEESLCESGGDVAAGFRKFLKFCENS